MKHLLLVALGLILSTSVVASDFDRRPPRKRRKAAKEQTVVTPAPSEVATPEPKDEPKDEPKPAPKTDVELGYTPEQTDSLVGAWGRFHREDAFGNFFREYVRIDSTNVTRTDHDSLYVKRLRALVSPIPLPFNDLVRRSILKYTASTNGTISRVLGRSQYYFPIIEEALLRNGMPVELRSLSIIESALLPTALSRMGASGLWQFMPTTGRSYGLEVNSVVDERRDPILASEAACRFLKDLYNMYQDWTLAIAAYNCGPGNVNKAFARAGRDSKTFWDIYPYLPRETRDYVPAFIGATYAYAYHAQHGIVVAEPPVPLAVDTLRITRLLHFGQIASTIDLPIETLRELNPQYMIDIVPATNKTYTLVVPQRKAIEFIEHEVEIYAKDSTYLKQYINPANIDKKKLESSARNASYYRVRKGDTLGSIAQRHHVSVKQLMRLNHIRNPRALRIGQRLRIR